MYPANLFQLYPPFPRENRVFVAMSFDPRFAKRWKEVIAPGIRRVRVNETPLEPIRVDARKVSDSILTEILTGVSSSRFIFADITTVGCLDDGQPIRSGNVMCEIGMAHAVRLPEEVILFRSDRDPLLFDTSNIRVNYYNPDDSPEQARTQIADAIISAGDELDLTRLLAVQRAAKSLDSPSWWLLTESQSGKGITHPKTTTMGQAIGNASRAAAIARLLELGLLQTVYLETTPDMLEEIGDSPQDKLLTYKPTEFGNVVFNEGARRLGLLSPEMKAYLEKGIQEDSD